jgi:hypothetical protein
MRAPQRRWCRRRRRTRYGQATLFYHRYIAKHAKPARQRIFKHWLCTVARKHLQMRLIRWQAAAAAAAAAAMLHSVFNRLVLLLTSFASTEI